MRIDLKSLTISKAHEHLKGGDFSAVELTRGYLDEIARRNPGLNAYLEVFESDALSQAAAADQRFKAGTATVLTGIPLAVKDNILIQGKIASASSRILENYHATYDATVISKLRGAGSVFLGRTNMDEFAMGGSTENSAFGPTFNPYDHSRVAGGSSGGSAAAVAMDGALFALGSDTGGSIRQPAAFCGTVGLKPTYGAVSRYGVIAMGSSLDQIGPLAKTVEDARIIFDIIKGRDEKDATSVEIRALNKFSAPVQNLKIGIPKEYFIKGIDPEVEKLVKEAIRKAEGLGAAMEEISLPHTQYALAVYYIIMPSEVSANLARYDGIKYGYSVAKSVRKEQNLLDVYLNSRGESFGEEVRRRIMLGTYALSAGYYEAYYLRAQKVRTLIKEDFDRAFKKVDLILTPTAPTPAFPLGEKMADPLVMYLSDIFTIGVNLAGLPALSMPVGKTGRLPVGLQIIGRPFAEETIFGFASALEEIL